MKIAREFGNLFERFECVCACVWLTLRLKRVQNSLRGKELMNMNMTDGDGRRYNMT
jgi:hypothetical protein